MNCDKWKDKHKDKHKWGVSYASQQVEFYLPATFSQYISVFWGSNTKRKNQKIQDEVPLAVFFLFISLLNLRPFNPQATLLKSWNTYIFRDKDRNMYFCLEYFWNLFPILVPWSFALALVRPLGKVAKWQKKLQRSQQISGKQNETSKWLAPQLAHNCETAYLWTAFAW